ncbi:MAG TPA: acyltransferase family protein, partial [Abditibacteriaceae bacterium]
MPIIDKFSYRPEVDGLRAIAVLAVVLYHAGFGFPGGYVGVDVFFVISGFLITSLIWKDLESGRFTFSNFWERRARRIVPALVVVTLATLAAGWFLLLPADFKSLGRASAAQTLFAANIHYWRGTNYFAAASDTLPLLHTWSLAVEEQFYLITPFVLWGMFRFSRLRSRNAVLCVLFAVFILSLALSVYGVARQSTATFYLLPARVWELLTGSIIAFLPAMSGSRSKRDVFALAGLALILVPIFVYTSMTPFPGLAALPPCLGAALVIWANKRDDDSIPTFVGRALAVRPVVFIGLISYSLYLWHWPFLAISKYLALAPLSAGYRAGLVALGFVFAILSWKYVETPFRTRRVGSTRKSVFAYATAGLAVVFVCGAIIHLKQGLPQRFPARVTELANAVSDTAFVKNLKTRDVRAGKLVRIGTETPGQSPAVMVWGDSYAMSALPAIDDFLKEKGLAGRAATYASTAPVLDWFTSKKFGLKEESVAYNNAILSYIQSEKIPDVVLIGNWTSYVAYKGETTEPFESALLKTVQRLVASGVRPWVVLEVPLHTFNVPVALSHAAIFNTDISRYCTKPTPENILSGMSPKTLAAIKAAGGRILDPKPLFRDPTGQYYIVESNGIPL